MDQNNQQPAKTPGEYYAEAMYPYHGTGEPDAHTLANRAIIAKAHNDGISVAQEFSQGFKRFTHHCLDRIGIAHDPGGPDSEAGCRIGARLTVVRLVIHDALELIAKYDFNAAEQLMKQLGGKLATSRIGNIAQVYLDTNTDWREQLRELQWLSAHRDPDFEQFIREKQGFDKEHKEFFQELGRDQPAPRRS